MNRHLKYLLFSLAMPPVLDACVTARSSAGPCYNGSLDYKTVAAADESNELPLSAAGDDQQDYLERLWSMGHAFAAGDGVSKDERRAFDIFSKIANEHAEDSANSPHGAIVAKAFDGLGLYYLKGIANSEIHADPKRAIELFFYAASYYRDADAQYHLALAFLSGLDKSPDAFQNGMLYLAMAAHNGQPEAQAELKRRLSQGGDVRH